MPPAHTRFVVVGAGAIGGVVGARLHEAGHDVLLVARGEHGRAIAERGLTLEDPERSDTFAIPVVADASDVAYRDGDVTLLCVKTQDTMGALDAIRRGGGTDRPLVCLQNGVANEDMALRVCAEVLGVAVMCPGEHLRPGVVAGYSTPAPGILDIGTVPVGGAEATAELVAASFRDAGFLSEVVPDIVRAKYSKLVMNLGNAIEVVCGPGGTDSALFGVVHAEGKDVLTAAGIAFDEGTDPRREHLRMRPVGGHRREGGSTWQSVRRGAGSLETDYLAGEIVLTARLVGRRAPANELLQRLAADVAAGRLEPAAHTPDDVLAMLAASSPTPQETAP